MNTYSTNFQNLLNDLTPHKKNNDKALRNLIIHHYYVAEKGKYLAKVNDDDLKQIYNIIKGAIKSLLSLIKGSNLSTWWSESKVNGRVNLSDSDLTVCYLYTMLRYEFRYQIAIHGQISSITNLFFKEYYENKCRVEFEKFASRYGDSNLFNWDQCFEHIANFLKTNNSLSGMSSEKYVKLMDKPEYKYVSLQSKLPSFSKKVSNWCINPIKENGNFGWIEININNVRNLFLSHYHRVNFSNNSPVSVNGKYRFSILDYPFASKKATMNSKSSIVRFKKYEFSNYNMTIKYKVGPLIQSGEQSFYNGNLIFENSEVNAPMGYWRTPNISKIEPGRRYRIKMVDNPHNSEYKPFYKRMWFRVLEQEHPEIGGPPLVDYLHLGNRTAGCFAFGANNAEVQKLWNDIFIKLASNRIIDKKGYLSNTYVAYLDVVS